MTSTPGITLPPDYPNFRAWDADAIARVQAEAQREAWRQNAPRVTPPRPPVVSLPGPLWRAPPTPFTSWKASQVWHLRQRVGYWGLKLPRVTVASVVPAADASHHLGSTRLDIDADGLYVAIRLNSRLTMRAFDGVVLHELKHAEQISSGDRRSREDEELDADDFAARVLGCSRAQLGFHHDALEPAWR